MNVRAMVLEAPGRIVPREFPLPEIREDDGLLRVELAGICHTDVALYHGLAMRPLPLILGHEIVGRIERVGPVAARRWGVREGDRVTVEPMARCGFCRACIEGRYRWCQDRIGYGTHTPASRPPHLFGSYAEFLYLAPGAVVHRVPDSLSPELATLSMVAISNAIQWTVLKGGVKLGDIVVIQGVGPIGLACVAVAREAGADLVIATGLSADAKRLELAKAFGADAVIDVEREPVAERLREITGGELADVVVDVTGSGSAVRTALDLVRPQGTVVNGGVTGDETLSPLPLDRTLYREIQFQGVYTFDAHAVRRALRLAQKQKYPFERLVTHYFPLEQAEQAVRTAGRELPTEQEPIKVVLQPR